MINKEQIENVIPHRGDMLLIDEIRDFNDQSGVGIHHVRADEFWCAGHFPGKPIMPGVLQVEALAQTACFIVLTHLNEDGGRRLGYFTTMEKIRFSHMVHPGDTLELHVEMIGSKLNLYKFHGIAMVGGMKVCEATFSAIMDKPEEV
ncbi:MAG: 3-hydroxyacyl-ACP dehydratase FabZ [Rickettsiales bacterium]|jgi:3-hydroxyacyl-[acyl-carrier-protein] dehydratase|nr:3-hydroxyacyl-ACP dehydratase FabZ [Rickettsiales bacterium]